MANQIDYRFGKSKSNVLTDNDDTEWAARCAFWAKARNPKANGVAKRQKAKEPLILTGYGVKLSIDRNTLLIRNGFTHYPQRREELRIFPGDQDLPSRVVVLDGQGGISFQALAWLSTQGVPLVQIDWQGNVVSVAGTSGRAADQRLVDAQREAKADGRGIRLAKKLVAMKIANAIETLRVSLPQSPATELAINRIEAQGVALSSIDTVYPNDIRGIEGTVAIAYRRAWQSFPLRWKGTGRQPIPDEWRRIGWRRSRLSDLNRHAHHPVNAMLNYAYGMLENDVRMHLVGLGFDLSIGVLHSYHHDKQPLVYDLMEPLRPVVDRAILDIVQRHTFTPGDFTLTDRGVCRLNPQLARMVVQAVDGIVDAAHVVKHAASEVGG